MTLAAAVALLSLAGCPVTQLNRLPASSPLAHPGPISAAGDFGHAPSGYVFPARVDAFQRVDLVQYDTAGLDVSAGYNDALPGCLVALTVYVYPTPRMTLIGADPDLVRSLDAQWLAGAYQEAKKEIARAHAEATLESEDATTQDGMPGKKAVYSIGDKQSELYLFVVAHSWFLEYRDTYSQQCAAQARQALEAFHKAWSGRAG